MKIFEHSVVIRSSGDAVALNNVENDKAATFNAFALVVAVANYRSVSSLPKVVLKDASDIRDMLLAPTHCGYLAPNVHVLLDVDATLENIRAELAWLAAVAGPNDSVIVYFSGHGVLPKTSADGASALVPWDADIASISSTCLSAAELSDGLRKISSARLLVLLDACHAGGSVVLKTDQGPEGVQLGFDEKSLAHLGQGTGRVAIASSRSSETSLILPGASNSVFTAHLLEVLRGDTPSKGDGFIRVFQVFEHIASTVPQSTNDRQHPLLKATELETNFPVALDKGGGKQLTGAVVQSASQFDWKRLEEIMSELYPQGPTDREIWLRAGGDLSRLKLSQIGRAAWFSSLMYLRQGGGDRSLVASLMSEARSDYPGHLDLEKLASTVQN
jgi:hypothetical protein